MEEEKFTSLSEMLESIALTVRERGVGECSVVQFGYPSSLTLGFTVFGPGETWKAHVIRVMDIEVDRRPSMATEESRNELASALELGFVPPVN